MLYCFIFLFIFFYGPGRWSIDAMISGDPASTGGLAWNLPSYYETHSHRVALVFIAQSLYAQEWAKERLLKSPRHGEYAEFKSGDRTIKAFVVYPERKEKAPVVLVVYEIFGMTDWVRGLADQLAENGVIAIVPDLLSGQVFEDVDGARKAISALPKEQVQADLDAAAAYALKLPGRQRHARGLRFLLGRGMGLRLTRIRIPKLKASYSFYGTAADEASKSREHSVSGLRFLRRERRARERDHPESGRADESRRQEI